MAKSLEQILEMIELLPGYQEDAELRKIAIRDLGNIVEEIVKFLLMSDIKPKYKEKE